jgi:mannose-6-phosphate isomerase-like protein (cupin superfamily)
MDAFESSDLIERRKASGGRYLEFLRVPALSAGVYGLAAGAPDPQSPHAEDEVYVVLRGRGTLRVADEDREMTAGSIAYVAAGVDHEFHSIEEDMEVLVLFAPAETGPASGATAGVGDR